MVASRGFGRLLSVDSDPKTRKSNALGEWYTAIQYLAPASLSGNNVCTHASEQCIELCLNTAGVPFQQRIKDLARIARTRYFFEQREKYLARLITEIEEHVDVAKRQGLRPCVRLNGTSDIVWERVAPQLFTLFPDVQFYDYSKIPKRFVDGWTLPPNYDLTFSRSETNYALTREFCKAGHRVAVVFGFTRTSNLPTKWRGLRVVDGDLHDLTFSRPRGVVLGLRVKGRARGIKNGFVVGVK